MEIRNFALRLPANIYKELEAVAEHMGISRNALMVIALSKYVKQVNKVRKTTKDKRTITLQILRARTELQRLEQIYKTNIDTDANK